MPLRNVKRPEGRRAQIFLRYRDDPEKATVKLYGGWLRSLKVLFIRELNWLVQGASHLLQFDGFQRHASAGGDVRGVDKIRSRWNNLESIQFDRSLARPRYCRTDGESAREYAADDQKSQEGWSLCSYLSSFQDSLRRFHVVRFYLQEKEDPHPHAVFVGNLPVSLAQRQYERILLKLLGAKGEQHHARNV